MLDSAQHLFDLAQEKIPPALRHTVEGHWRAFRENLAHLPLADAQRWLPPLPGLFAASDFLAQICIQHPDALKDLIDSGELFRAYAPGELTRAVVRALAGTPDEHALKARLRRLRRREMLRIAFRDLARWSDLDETTTTLSELADASIDAALTLLHGWAVDKHGEPRGDNSDAPQRLVVLGMGKLGGRELNFSSDVDLIFCYAEDGQTRGARALADGNEARAARQGGRDGGLSNHEFFVRLGQRLTNALSESTEDGFVFRVDLRLRPNGASGPLALSFDAMEHYYQTHGRDWERYAFIKARAVAGDREAGEELLRRLKPFVFRKYLDYGAIESIRTMKVMIEREVARKAMQSNIKLGPGGIREIEFIAQALQLIRGGREPQLQERRCVKVLAQLAARGYLAASVQQELTEAYVFLRNSEHRLQMVADSQTHALPGELFERTRLAFAAGFNDWPAYEKVLERHRRKVQEHFSQVFVAPQGEAAEPTAGLSGVWLNAVGATASLKLLAKAGYTQPEEALQLLTGLRGAANYEAMAAESRARLDRLMPLLIGAAGLTHEPLTTLSRLIRLVEAIGRRATYFALLVENPMVLSQLVKLAAASEWIASWIALHPIVLDELLDPASLYVPLTREGLAEELRTRLAAIPSDDLELQMEVLREFRHSYVLRVAAAALAAEVPADHVAAHLAWIAEVLIAESLEAAWQALVAKHGEPACPGREERPGFAVIGYGKLGSLELGYASDLDIIFMYEDCAEGATVEGMTTGQRPLPNETFFARVAQRFIHIVTTRTPGGVLYEVDTRLRPSGKSGPLVTGLAAFRRYQETQAWTWEQQALVRARPVAGKPELCAGFAAARREILCRARDPDKLKAEVADMRTKMIAAQPSHDAADFDLKHDRGGIVDIEFMVQYAVLRWAHEDPELAERTDNIHLLKALADAGRIDRAQAEILTEAFRRYLSMEHRLKLMERRALVPRAELGDLPERVAAIWNATFS
jgi:glutamate-ammonia-ligase adenylyltransferase